MESVDYEETSTTTLKYNETIIEFGKHMDVWYTVLCGMAVLFARTGFLMLHLCCVPTHNVMAIVIQDVLDVTLSSLVFIVLGFGLAFGKDFANVVGTTNFFLTGEYRSEVALLAWCICITVTAIVLSVTVSRVRMVSFVIQTVVFVGIILPLILHWTKSDRGWMRTHTLMDHMVEFQDYAGSAFIHVCGGTVALVSTIALGRKVMVLAEMDEKSLPPSSPILAVTGYFFVILGFVGIGSASFICVRRGVGIAYRYSIDVVLNTVVAISSGVLVTLVVSFSFQRQLTAYWTALKCIQGGLAGLVSISGGLNAYTSYASFIISTIGSLIFCLWAPLAGKMFVEDYLNTIGVHFLCGIFGTLMPPLADKEYGFIYGGSHQALLNLGWNCVCLIVIIAFVMFAIATTIWCLNFFGILRTVDDEVCNIRAQIIASQSPGKTACQRLFEPEEGKTVYVRPGYCTKAEVCVENMITHNEPMSFHEET